MRILPVASLCVLGGIALGAPMTDPWQTFTPRSAAKQAGSPEPATAPSLRIAMPARVKILRGKPLPLCITVNRFAKSDDSALIVTATEVGTNLADSERISLGAGPVEWRQHKVTAEEEASARRHNMNVDYAPGSSTSAVPNPLEGAGVHYFSYDLNEFRAGVVSIFENSRQEGLPGDFTVTATLGALKSPPIRVHFEGR